MKKREPISHIMTKNIVTVNHTHSLHDVQKLMDEKGIHHLPVVSGEKLIGIISKTDLERITFVSNFEKDEISTQMYDALTIEQVMTKQTISIQQDDTILDAATILAKHEFHALPILDGENVVGIVTTTDMLKFLIDQF